MPDHQLALDLPHRAAFGRDDFLVSDSNVGAVSLIDAWPDWPTPIVLLIGPPGSGKTHLVEVWRHMSGARVAGEFGGMDAPLLLSSGGLAIEDLPGNNLDETALFHVINLAREMKASVLLTSRVLPAAWGIRLPDLASRLNAIPAAVIGPADDALLRGVLLKLFADRQIVVDETLLSFLIARMPRSLETARVAVAEIDRLALEHRAEINRSFAARILPQIFDKAQLNLFIE